MYVSDRRCCSCSHRRRKALALPERRCGRSGTDVLLLLLFACDAVRINDRSRVFEDVLTSYRRVFANGNTRLSYHCSCQCHQLIDQLIPIWAVLFRLWPSSPQAPATPSRSQARHQHTRDSMLSDMTYACAIVGAPLGVRPPVCMIVRCQSVHTTCWG